MTLRHIQNSRQRFIRAFSRVIASIEIAIMSISLSLWFGHTMHSSRKNVDSSICAAFRYLTSITPIIIALVIAPRRRPLIDLRQNAFLSRYDTIYEVQPGHVAKRMRGCYVHVYAFARPPVTRPISPRSLSHEPVKWPPGRLRETSDEND